MVINRPSPLICNKCGREIMVEYPPKTRKEKETREIVCECGNSFTLIIVPYREVNGRYREKYKVQYKE